MTQVVHHPRVAWDGALVLTLAAKADESTYAWCSNWVEAVLGPSIARALASTRRRLADPTLPPSEQQVQEGLWRVRLEDALRGRPGIAGELLTQTTETRSRLAHR